MGKSLLQDAQNVLQYFRDCGCKINPSSRFGHITRILEKGYVSPDHPDFNIAQEAVREVQQMDFIFRELSSIQQDKTLKDKVKKLIKDSVLPEEGDEHSFGRDAQCELYVAAICQKAGLHPVLVEPDIQCALGSIQYGIAVKRLKSDKQVEELVRKAVNQIEGCGLPGHIALDVSLAFNRDNQKLINVSDRQIDRAYKQARQRFGDDYYKRFKSWARGREARSVILIDHFIRQHPENGWTLDSFKFFINLSPDNQRRTREFDQFRRTFEFGLATPKAQSSDSR